MGGEKARYKVTNWAQYNKSLERRGDVTIWIPEDACSTWHAKPTGNPGNPFTYSDAAIECALTIRAVFHLPLRSTVGFIKSILRLMNLQIETPHYSTLSRRTRNLDLELDVLAKTGPLHLAIDSTGLKVFGEGEWKVRTHGADKRRVWRKLHIGVDIETKEIVSMELTENCMHDSSQTAKLLPKNRKIAAVYGDGAYDNQNSYQPISEAGAEAKIPPRSGACLTPKHIKKTKGTALRDQNVKDMWKQGRKEWKVSTGYHKRSHVENAMYRIKTIFGGRVSSREKTRQKSEARIKIRALNRITNLGMPESVKKSW
jgi:hypothetical protein